MTRLSSLALGTLAATALFAETATAETVAFRPGFYAGGFVGWVDSHSKPKESLSVRQTEPVVGEPIDLSTSTFTPGGVSDKSGDDAFSGGALLGYSFIGSGMLLAIEGDLAFNTSNASSKGTGTASSFNARYADNTNGDLSISQVDSAGGAISTSSSFDTDGSIRGRLGTDIGYGMRIFATAGFAFGKLEHKATATRTYDTEIDGGGLSGTPISQTLTAISSKWKAGWTLGGGLDVALWGPWSARVEYRYIDLGSTKLELSFADGSVQTVKFDDKEQVVRFGLVYAF